MRERLKRLLPKSLIGQIALVMAGALLVAQAINFTLIFTERQRLTRAQIEGPPVARFVLTRAAARRGAAGRARGPAAAARAARPLHARPGKPDPGRRRRRGACSTGCARRRSANGLALRDARAAIVEDVPAGPAELRERLPAEDRERLDDRRQRLAHAGPLGPVRRRDLADRPDDRAAPQSLGDRAAADRHPAHLSHHPGGDDLGRAAAGAAVARAGRRRRSASTAAAKRRGSSRAGPADVNRAILAFNAMSARAGAMLDEKDRMLGAIGHDLRTPLASLRIRAESVEPAEDRAAMIATIEEMAAMLDDTLALARSGRAVEEVRAVDLAALADTVVEEYRALGKEVTLVEGASGSARVQPRLLRRAVRNLVANAVDLCRRDAGRGARRRRGSC